MILLLELLETHPKNLAFLIGYMLVFMPPANMIVTSDEKEIEITIVLIRGTTSSFSNQIPQSAFHAVTKSTYLSGSLIWWFGGLRDPFWGAERHLFKVRIVPD